MLEQLASYLFVLKVIAVAFGVLAGALVGRFIAAVLGKSRARLPVMLGCAALGGVVVWLALGRYGPGSGPGPGGGGGSLANGDNQQQPTRTTPDAGGEVARVRMLGGQQVKNDRIYVLDGKPRTWDELREALKERQERDKQLRSVEIIIEPDSVDRDNPAVQRLIEWSIQRKLRPSTVLEARAGS